MARKYSPKNIWHSFLKLIVHAIFEVKIKPIITETMTSKKTETQNDVLKALKNTNERLLILKKQLQSHDESWLSELIKENEEIIQNAE